MFVMPVAGMVNNWLEESDCVGKNAIIATVNEEDMALERKEVEVKILKERVSKQEERQKLENQLAEIEHYQKLDSETKKWRDRPPDAQNPDILDSIRRKIDLLDRELELFEDTQRRNFAKKEESYVLKMPYNGKLQYQFSFPNDGSVSLYLESGAPIATVCDDSAYYITLSISNPELTRINPELLSVSIPLGNGEVITGNFSHKRVEKNSSSSGNDTLAYFFKISPRDHEQAYRMIGSYCVASLFYTPKEPVIFLNKVALAATPEGKSSSSWLHLLNKLHPEYELILEGESQLIVRKK